jgi:hypothetical protein
VTALSTALEISLSVSSLTSCSKDSKYYDEKEGLLIFNMQLRNLKKGNPNI